MAAVRKARGSRGRIGRVVLAAGVVLLASSADVATTRAATEPGFGKAQAQILMLDPRSAQLSFGVRFGPTVADHRNLVARAQAHSTDYGLIGGAITGEGCNGDPPAVAASDLPQPMRADSREPKDLAERTVSEGPITQSVQADPRPHARATSRLGEALLPGILALDGATSSTVSGVDDEGIAEVTATVDVGKVDLLDGVVVLGGLHWEASYRGDGDPVGLFTLGTATIGGVPIPTQDASAVIEAVNNVVSELGIVITPPTSHREADTIFVDPIKVGVAPNQTRDLLAGELLALLQPAREQLFQVILDNVCGSGGYITVVDLLLGSVTGGGSFTAVLGGAQAQLVAAAPDSGGPGSTGGTGSGGPALGGAGGAGSAGGAFTPARPGTGTAGSGTAGSGGSPSAPTVAVSTTTDADDHAAWVAAAVLLLGGLLVEADRRKMRQAGTGAAPLTVPTEAPHG